MDGSSQLTDPLTKRTGETAFLRDALARGTYGLTAEAHALERRREERQKKKEQHTYSDKQTGVYFSSLDLYELDVTGTMSQASGMTTRPTSLRPTRGFVWPRSPSSRVTAV